MIMDFQKAKRGSMVSSLDLEDRLFRLQAITINNNVIIKERAPLG